MMDTREGICQLVDLRAKYYFERLDTYTLDSKGEPAVKLSEEPLVDQPVIDDPYSCNACGVSLESLEEALAHAGVSEPATANEGGAAA
jgi:hypothetical protein